MSTVTPIDRRAPTPAFLERRLEHYYVDRFSAWPTGEHVMRGRKPQPGDVRLQSNDYLCMTSNAAVVDAHHSASERARNALLVASVFLDDSSEQAEFERSMSRFMCSESTVLCQSGWAANVGLLQAMVTSDVPVYIDIFAHMSLYEGVSAAGAHYHVFPHNSVSRLEKLVKRYGPGFIVVDSVYSTSGSIAPLCDIVGVGIANGCVLVVDESHSLGTHGPQGRGLVVELGLEELVHFRTASLAKAFAGRAGIIACAERHAEFIHYHSNPAVFSSSVLPHEIVVLDATRRRIEVADRERQKLQENSAYLRGALTALGYNVDESKSQIISLEAGEEFRTIKLRNALESRGVFGSVFCAPATPKNRSLVRFTINSGLTREELDRIINVCGEIRDEVGMEEWHSTRRKGRLALRAKAASGEKQEGRALIA